MNYFFEPVNLKQWNMFNNVKNINHVEHMLATKEMKLNDIVLLHVGKQCRNKESGIYSWGVIVKKTYILRNSPSEYCNNKNTVDVKIKYIDYEKPLILSKENKLFNQYRTVHKLQPDELKKLEKVISLEIFKY